MRIEERSLQSAAKRHFAGSVVWVGFAAAERHLIPLSEAAYTALQESRLATIHPKCKEIASDRSPNARSPLIQFPEAYPAISGIINLVNSAAHPSKHAAGHELLASFRLWL
jgi:hypothetical protein